MRTVIEVKQHTSERMLHEIVIRLNHVHRESEEFRQSKERLRQMAIINAGPARRMNGRRNGSGNNASEQK